MESNIYIKCAICGDNMHITDSRYKIVDEHICRCCADTLTITDIYSAEKIKSIYFFNGEMWYNPLVGPDNEGDNGRSYEGELEPAG